LMLEITVTLFSLACLTTGVSLIAILSIIFYPLHTVLTYASLLLKNTRNPPNDQLLSKEKNETVIETPIIIKQDVKEKKE